MQAKQFHRDAPEMQLPMEIVVRGEKIVCQHIVRFMAGERVVLQGQWRGRKVLVKRFPNTLSSKRKVQRTVRGYQSLHAAAVPTPPLLLHALCDAKSYIVVFEFLEHAQTLQMLWPQQEHRHAEFAAALLRLLAQIHRAGCSHTDLHLNNFLLVGEKIFAIDLDAFWRRKKLQYGRWQRSNLTRLFVRLNEAQLPIFWAALAANYPQAALDKKLPRAVVNVRRRRKGEARTLRKYLRITKQHATDLRNKFKRIVFLFRYLVDRYCPLWMQPHLAAADTFDEKTISERVNYYNQRNAAFTVQDSIPFWRQRFRRKRIYVADMIHHLKRFDKSLRLDYYFGDNSRALLHPTIIKSRPVAKNQQCILLKLDSIRHFFFVQDALPFAAKKDMAVWRGAVGKKSRRKLLLQKYQSHPQCDFADAQRRRNKTNYLPISAQLQYKFIVSIEGNDTATNTKWIMSSNSLCIMPRPTCETWFMEGKLIADYHYVQIADDYTDLADKIRHYIKHPEQALAIIANAQKYVAQFQDAQREDYIAHRVLQKYFRHCGQRAD